MHIVVIVQARMGSTRLPGKVMLDLEGKTVLAHVIERCRNISHVNDVVIATTDQSNDDPIQQEAERLGVLCYRGSETNVLQRYYEAAKMIAADIIVRVTSDCPLLDPEVSTHVIAKYFAEIGTDYCSNTMIRCFPQGLDIEVFSFNALEQAYLNASHLYEQEHVTPYIYKHPERFKLTSYTTDDKFSHFRWTLDTIEDWQLIQAIYRKLYVPKHLFSWRDALSLMEAEPQLQNINKSIQQKKLTD